MHYFTLGAGVPPSPRASCFWAPARACSAALLYLYLAARIGLGWRFSRCPTTTRRPRHRAATMQNGRRLGITVLLACLVLPPGVRGVDTATSVLGIELGLCSEASASGWRWDRSGSYQISRTDGGTTRCLGVSSVSAGAQPTLQACNTPDAGQQWVVSEGTVAVKSSPSNGWVSEGGSQQPGERVWLYNVVAEKGYCTSHRSCSFIFSGGQFKNPAGNCVVTAPAAPSPPPAPPAPHSNPGAPPDSLALTCAEGSPEAALPFCDVSLGFDKRAEDLVNRLNTTEQIGYFFSYPSTPYIERFNAKT